MRSACATTLVLATMLANMFACGGCGDDVSSSAETEGTGTTGGDATTTDVSPGTSTTQTSSMSVSTGDGGSSSTDPTSGGFEPADPECGNGFVEADEQCDDGNDDDADGCNNACQFQCGLQWSRVELAQTDQSRLDPRGVAVDPDGGALVVAFSREITTDQKGNQTIADDEGLVVALDAEGESRWTTRLFEADADVTVEEIVVDAEGDAYIAASVAEQGEDSDIVVYKLAGADGAMQWTHVYDSAVDSAQDVAFGLALDPSGNPVVSGQVRVAEGDDDILVRKLDAASGDELWTSTWSGEATGGFSTDDGGPVSIGPDGAVFVLAGEYAGFDSQLATLLRFDAGGGEVLATQTLQVEGGQQDYLPLAIAAGDDGSVTALVLRFVAGGNEFFFARLDGDTLTEAWRLDAPTIEAAANVRGASDFVPTDVAYSTEGDLVALGILDRNLTGATVNETWTARVAADSTLGCTYVQQGPQGSLVPGELLGRAVETGSSGEAVVAAQQFDGDVQALWIGAFRPE